MFPVVFCLFFDVATPDRPRVAHLFLPAGAILGYLNYRREPSFLQIVLILLSIAALYFLVEALLLSIVPYLYQKIFVIMVGG